ncbi:TolC family protein [Fluviicola taffensis]|uniref:TolC family protein n=1 Tax=Fluviicola taffensis TaxID=191579 RepID=UPI003137E9B6
MNKIKSISFILLLVGLDVSAQNATILPLDTCLSKALEQNKRIKAADFEIEAAKATKKSVDANAFPEFDASLMGIYLGKPLGGGFNGMIPEAIASGSVNATIPIYVGGKIINGKAAAAKAIEIYEAQKRMTVADVLLSTKKAYWQIIQVKEKIELAKKYELMLAALETDLNNSYNAGLIYKNDLLRVQVSRNEAKLAIEKAQDGLELAKLNLALLIGLKDISFDVQDQVVITLVADATQTENTVAARPEIDMLNKSIEAMEFQRKITRGDNLPTIGLAVSGLGTAGKRVNIKDGSNTMFTYYGVLSISVPIFDWGKTSNKVKEQSFKIAAQQEQLENTKELINLEIQHAELMLKQSLRQIEVAEQSLVQADENLKLADDRLKSGTIVGKDVQEAQAIWQNAYSKLIDARIEYMINEATYKKAVGLN